MTLADVNFVLFWDAGILGQCKAGLPNELGQKKLWASSWWLDISVTELWICHFDAQKFPTLTLGWREDHRQQEKFRFRQNRWLSGTCTIMSLPYCVLFVDAGISKQWKELLSIESYKKDQHLQCFISGPEMTTLLRLEARWYWPSDGKWATGILTHRRSFQENRWFSTKYFLNFNLRLLRVVFMQAHGWKKKFVEAQEITFWLNACVEMCTAGKDEKEQQIESTNKFDCERVLIWIVMNS